jgi:hypothetical protein
VVLVLAISAYSTYEHSLWTLMYRDLTGQPAATPSVVATKPPAPPQIASPPGGGVQQDHWQGVEGGSDKQA